MADHLQLELDKLTAAAAGLEAQRTVLGDAIVQPALDSLYEKIASLKGQFQAEDADRQEAHPVERRIVTILFCDMVGSTFLASQYDPEEWHETIAAIYALAGAQIHKYHGVVLQYLGDGLLALFGLKNTTEQDPDNALRAALAIQAGIPNLTARLKLAVKQELQMRIGVHTGLVVIGELGSETKTELTATGDPMNVAARLQVAAPPGGILITHDTYRYVRESFEVAAQPPLLVKGKTEPLRTYVVYRARQARFRTQTRGVAGIESPIVGRDAELERLRAAFDQVVSQKTTSWLQIIGEPGIGKSRLLYEMRDYFPEHVPKFRLLKCRAFAGDEHQPYAAVRWMLMDFFHIPEDAPAEEIEARWMAAIRSLAQSGPTGSSFGLDERLIDEGARALGYLIGVPFSMPGAAPGEAPDPAELKSLAMVLSRRLISILRGSAPLVLLLEDLHWLDHSSWDFFIQLFLVRTIKASAENDGAGLAAFSAQPDLDSQSKTLGSQQGPPEGVFVLATSRLEWSAPSALRQHPAYAELALCPLSEAASEQLIRGLLKDVAGIPEQIIRRMVERSEGIPYFIEEMVNLLLDLGVIDQSTQPWQFQAEKYDASLLPATLQHLLQTRLDHLAPQEKTAIQYGAVLGRRFWEGWLESQLSVPCHDPLVALQSRGFVSEQVEAAFDGEVEWRFFHQAQQEVAYASLLKRQRKALHNAAAAWLEQLAIKINRLDEFAGPVGEHAQEAGDLAKASAWYFQAGSHAKDRGALAEARAYYERALYLLPEDDLHARWKILLEHDEVLGFLSDTQARLVEDELLVSLAQAMGREDYLAEAYDRQGNYLSYCGDNLRAAELLRKAYHSAIATNNPGLACRALGMLIISLAKLGEMDEAGTWAEQVLDLAYRSSDDLTLAKALSNLSTYYTLRGNHCQAVQMINQQVIVTRQMKHRMGEAIGMGNLGYEYLHLGMYSLGIVTLEKALELANAYGMLRDAAYTQLNLGLAYIRMKDFAAAQQALDTAMQRLAGTQDAYGLAAGSLYLGLAFEMHGDPRTAEGWFRQAQQTYAEIHMPSGARDSQAGLARCALARGDLPTAQALNQELWAHLQANGAVGMEFPILAYQACAMVFDRSGQEQEMAQALRAGYRLLTENASQISDPNWRRIYLHEIPENDWTFYQMSVSQTPRS